MEETFGVLRSTHLLQDPTTGFCEAKSFFDSINNPYGAGNPFKADSPTNPYGKGLSIFSGGNQSEVQVPISSPLITNPRLVSASPLI